VKRLYALIFLPPVLESLFIVWFMGYVGVETISPQWVNFILFYCLGAFVHFVGNMEGWTGRG